MTALDAVSVYVPSTRVSVESLAGSLGLTDMQVKLFRRFHGLREVSRDPDASLYGLLMSAAAGLDALRGQEHRVRYVLYARTMPVVAPYPDNPLHEVCRALGLEHAIAFTVTHQSCASGLLAIDMAGRLLAADGAVRRGRSRSSSAARRRSPGRPRCSPTRPSSVRARPRAWSARSARATECSRTRPTCGASSTAPPGRTTRGCSGSTGPVWLR